MDYLYILYIYIYIYICTQISLVKCLAINCLTNPSTNLSYKIDPLSGNEFTP